MDPILTAAIVNGLFQLAAMNVNRTEVIDKLTGVPPEKYPDILDSMYAESVAKRNAAIAAAPE